MRRLFLLVPLVLVAVPLAVALMLYAAGDGDQSTTVVTPTPFVRGDGDPTCADGDVDPFAHDAGDLSLAEAEERIALEIGRSVPVPEPPELGWSATVSAERITLFAREDAAGESPRFDIAAGAVRYSPDREGTPHVIVLYQPLPKCERLGPPRTTGVSTGSASVEVRYWTYNGGRSTSSDGGEEFTYEAVEGTFELPDDPLMIVITLERDEALAPEERIQVAELENWTRAVLNAAYVIEQ